MKRTRIVAAAVAMALVGASAVVLSTPAYGVANVPDQLNTGGATTFPTPLIQGFYDNSTGDEIDIRVEVSNGGPYTPYCIDSILASETAPNEGWGCGGAPLAYGDYTFRSYAFDTLNALQSGYSATTFFQIGGAESVAIVAPLPGFNTPDATVTFTGTGPARGSAIVFDNVLGTLCSSPIDITGNWSCTTTPLETALHVVYALGETIDFSPGLQTITPDQNLIIDSPVTPSVDPYPFVAEGSAQPAVQGNNATDTGQILAYWSLDNSTWNLYCTVPTNTAQTVWFCTTPSGTLPLGTIYIAAVANSEALSGPSSSFSVSQTIERVPPPVLASPGDGAYTNDNTPLFTGTSTYGATANIRLVNPSLPLCSSPITAGAWSCTSDVLGDGTYQWSANAQPGNAITSAAFTITIDTVAPGIPVITSPGMTTTDTRPVLRGTAEAGAFVQVYRDGALAGCMEGSIYANGSGVWQCTSSTTLSVGETYQYGAVQTDYAGNRSSIAVPPTTLSLTIVGVPKIEPVAAPPVLLAWKFSFGIRDTEFAPGQETEINATGLPVGAAVDVEIHSTPANLGATVVGSDGVLAMPVTIPEDIEAGAHTIVVTVTPLEGPPSVQEQAVMVRIPPKAAAESGHEQTFVAPPGATGEQRNDPAAPSSMTNSLETAQSIFSNPVVIGGAAIAGLVLLLLVAFPAELLNSTLSEQYPRFAKRLPAVRLPWWQRFTSWLRATPLVGGTLMIIVAAVIFGFADPGFGFDITSLRLVLACAIALFVLAYLASALTGVIGRRRWGLSTVMELLPLGLILTIVGVVLSRLLDFSPGVLLGLFLGVALVGRTTAAERAKVVLVQVGIIFAISMTAWLTYSVLSAAGPPQDFGTALLFDVLVILTSEGLTALFVGLLPFRYFFGSVLFAHSKLLWAAIYAFSALAFVLVVLPASWGAVNGSLGVWLGIVGGFAVIATGLYLYFRFWAPPIDEDDEDDDDDETIRRVTQSASA